MSPVRKMMADPEMPEAELKGRHALITGGANGLGRAIAERFARSGAAISIIDLEPAIASADLPADWTATGLDLTASDAEKKLDEFADQIGTLDVLVANAGVVPPWRKVSALDRQEWQNVFNINVWGAAVCMKCCSAALERSTHGSVVLMASINGYRAHPDQVLYTASKHAVIGLMRSAALDLGRQKIRVNALAPGPVATDALLGRIEARHQSGGPAPADALKSLDQETALGRIATKEMVADAALFLASDLSAGMTGTVLPVESGLG